MAVTVGRVRPCPILDLRLVLLGHNTDPRRRGPGGADRRAAGGRRPGRSAAGMIVCKFGGTSVADAGAIARLVEIVRARSAERPVVVVSALARVTDALLALAPSRCTPATATRWTQAVDALLQRHETTARELPGGEAALEPIRADDRGAPQRAPGALGRRLRPPRLDRLGGVRRAVELAAHRGGDVGRGAAGGVAGHPADHGHRRPLRPGHAVHPGALHPGAANVCCRWPRPGRCRSPRVRRRDGRRDADHARTGRVGLQRGAARSRGVGPSGWRSGPT